MALSRTDFTGLNDMYVDTAAYMNQLDPAMQNYLMQDPKEIDTRRIRAYKYFIDFYKGRQWEESGEFNPAYGNKSLINEEFNRRSWNHAKNAIDKLVTFLVKEPWSIKLPPELEDEFDTEEESETDDTENPVFKTLEAVWAANNRQAFSYKMAYMGCITGDCFIKVSYDEDFYADGVGELKFDVLDSRMVLPYFDGMDRDKMIACRIQWTAKEIQADGSDKSVIYTEFHTDSSIITLIDGEVDNIAPNPLGEMLIVHIKNEPLPFERFGRSDLYDLIIPSKEYNEKISDLSEILAYHAAPVTIVKGARVQSLEKGARKIWGGIPKDGDVYNLALDADLTSSLAYIDKLKQHIHETSGVPEEVLGKVQAVSNTSGSALHLQYQPLVDRTQVKQICYSMGLKQLNRLVIRFYEAVGALEIPEGIHPALRYKTSIEWGDALPRDRSILLADISTEMGLGIESKKGALKRTGNENPKAKLEEIKEESLDQAEMDFMTTGLSGFGDPSAGADGMGTATGANDGPQNDVSGAVDAAKTNSNTQGEQTSVQAVKKSAQTTTNANSKKP